MMIYNNGENGYLFSELFLDRDKFEEVESESDLHSE
jgi:hypothetical protein